MGKDNEWKGGEGGEEAWDAKAGGRHLLKIKTSANINTVTNRESIRGIKIAGDQRKETAECLSMDLFLLLCILGFWRQGQETSFFSAALVAGTCCPAASRRRYSGSEVAGPHP